MWPSESRLGRAIAASGTLPPPLPLLDSSYLRIPVALASEIPPPVPEPVAHTGPRDLLVKLADALIDIRYRRGGRDPSTGFDCSGFVRYVFENSIGLLLPHSSAAQFHAGERVDRHDLRRGDLVFFHIRGKRVSHVGIYVADGRFIHAPSAGKRVRMDRLDEAYWARHFAGARRVGLLAQRDDAKGGASAWRAP